MKKFPDYGSREVQSYIIYIDGAFLICNKLPMYGREDDLMLNICRWICLYITSVFFCVPQWSGVFLGYLQDICIGITNEDSLCRVRYYTISRQAGDASQNLCVNMLVLSIFQCTCRKVETWFNAELKLQ